MGENELGWGNVAQTVGYKMGMIIGGGVLLQVATVMGADWPGFFYLMGALVSLSLIPLYFYDEPRGRRMAAAAEAASCVDVNNNDFSDGELERTSSPPMLRDDYKMAPDLPEVRHKRSPKGKSTNAPHGASGDGPPALSLSEPSCTGEAAAAAAEDESGTTQSSTATPGSILTVGSMLCRQLQTREGLLTLIIVFSYQRIPSENLCRMSRFTLLASLRI